MKHTYFSLMTASILLLSACDRDEKDDEKNHDHDHKTEITFLSPVDGGVYNENDTLWIQVKMKAEKDLHDFSFEVKNLTSGTTDFTYNGHTHGNEINSKLPFIPSVSADSDMELWVKNKDHDGNLVTEKRITFKVKNVTNTVKPVINVISPAANEDFHHGDAMRIRGNFSHIDLLKEVSVKVTRNGINVLDYKPTLSAVKVYNFDTTHTINSPGGHADYEVILTAKDYDNNTTTRTLFYHVH